MKTKSEILKTRATLLYILNKFPQGVDYIKLFKILYFAQRQHLVSYGRVIVNDTFHARTFGPVPSFTYAALKALEKNACTKDFETFLNNISIKSKLVISEDIPDMDELSLSNIECLDFSIQKCKNKNSYQLSAMSHDDAWFAAEKRKVEDPENDRMTIIEIAKAGKASDEIIDYIRNMQLIHKSIECAY
jgi:uncharacterized phage-associated protein